MHLTVAYALASEPERWAKFTMYNKHYYYDLVPITWEQILKLRTEFLEQLRFKMMPATIKPFIIRPAFEDIYGPSWRKFEELFHEYQNRIRKYEFELTKRCGLTKDESKFGIEVRIKGTPDQTTRGHSYPSIGIMNYWRGASDFEAARKLLEKILNLQFSEEQLQEDLLARFSYSIVNEELKGKVCRAMEHHDYDSAMSGASVLVEAKLRHKCLGVGGTSANGQTGVNLAVTAYHESKGCLNPPFTVATQASHGVFLIFQGFFHYIRNAYGHHSTVMGKNRECIIEFLNLCESLLKIIEKSTKR